MTGTYTVSQDSKTVTVTMSGAHNLQDGAVDQSGRLVDNRVFLDFTSGTNVVQTDNNAADPSNNYVTHIPPDGLYEATITASTTFTIQIPNELR